MSTPFGPMWRNLAVARDASQPALAMTGTARALPTEQVTEQVTEQHPKPGIPSQPSQFSPFPLFTSPFSLLPSPFISRSRNQKYRLTAKALQLADRVGTPRKLTGDNREEVGHGR